MSPRNHIAIVLGATDLGCYNPETFHETPVLDALASRSTRFTQGGATCCVCSPTRASLMTGKYPARTGVTDFIGGRRSGAMLPASYAKQLALEEVTIAERLASAGRDNFFAGKWHLGGVVFTPSEQGFGPLKFAGGTFRESEEQSGRRDLSPTLGNQEPMSSRPEPS